MSKETNWVKVSTIVAIVALVMTTLLTVILAIFSDELRELPSRFRERNSLSTRDYHDNYDNNASDFGNNVDLNGTYMGVGEIIQFGGRDWRILQVQGDRVLILHETVIVNQPFHHTLEAVTWEVSSSRTWLNGAFFNSFSAMDRARIIETYIVNNDNPWTFSPAYPNNAPGGNSTTDRIFLLSIDEVARYFGGYELLDLGRDENNRDGSIPGLFWLRIWENDHVSESRIAQDERGLDAWWLLRSPGITSTTVADVYFTGQISIDGHFVNYSSSSVGLRPALWLSLEPYPIISE